MERLIYPFSEGNRSMGEILGGKGANLAEMTNAGLPVPGDFCWRGAFNHRPEVRSL